MSHRFRILPLIFMVFVVLPISSMGATREVINFAIKINGDPISCDAALGESSESPVEQLKNFLVYEDPTMGTEYIQALLLSYVDFMPEKTGSEFYGMATIQLTYTSPIKKETYLKRLEQTGRYQEIIPLIP